MGVEMVGLDLVVANKLDRREGSRMRKSATCVDNSNSAQSKRANARRRRATCGSPYDDLRTCFLLT